MNTKIREFPGYYYDDEKKKYFKIRKDYKPPRKASLRDIRVVTNKKSYCLTKILYNETMLNKSLSTSFLKRSSCNVLTDRISCDWRNSMKIQDTEEESEHVQLLKVSQNGRKMAVVFGKSGFLSNRLHIYDVEKNIEGSIAFKTNHRNETLRNSKITSFCWTDDQSANEFVYSSVSERLLRPGFITRSSQFTLADVKNGFKSTITDFTQINAITTNCNTSSEKLIAIGESSGRVCLYQNRTFQRKWHLESSPQVLKFSKAIVLTDLRMRKTVVEYYGHVNNHSKLKFHLNSSEDYLFAAGSDSLLRFWTVKSGELFQERNINTEQSMSIPQLVYSSRWSGDDSLSGILCCDRNNYIFWPFL